MTLFTSRTLPHPSYPLVLPLSKDNHLPVSLPMRAPQARTLETGEAKAHMEEQAADMGRVGHPGVGKWPKAWKQLYITAGHCEN